MRDADMYYGDVIRLDIIGAATVSGTISNIDADLIPDPSADITVKLRNLMTWRRARNELAATRLLDPMVITAWPTSPSGPTGLR